MGNIVGTVQWKKSIHDERLLDSFEILRKKHGLLKADSHYLPYCRDGDKESYGVEINGLDLGWKGHEYSNKLIKSYLYDASELLKKFGLEAKTNIEFLPM